MPKAEWRVFWTLEVPVSTPKREKVVVVLDAQTMATDLLSLGYMTLPAKGVLESQPLSGGLYLSDSKGRAHVESQLGSRQVVASAVKQSGEPMGRGAF